MSTFLPKGAVRTALLFSLVPAFICGTAHAGIAVKGRQLLLDGKPYIIHGVSWSPATRAPEKGPNPEDPKEEVDYGFFFDWDGRVPQGHDVFNYWLRSQYVEYFKPDIALMKQMNVNTVRVYQDFGDDPAVYKAILDEFQKNGIKVIMTVVASREEMVSERYLRIVGYCKDHPAILMWSLGNEWNLDFSLYYGYEKVVDAAEATENAARKIKELDPSHPVSSCLGDRFKDEKLENTIPNVLRICRSVDIWGLNIYRGDSFGGLFSQWCELSDKPMYISEFGTDSFRTSKYTNVEGYKAGDCRGEADEKMQADYDLKLWRELEGHLSALNPSQPCIGGLVHEFNDELYKVGSYHMKLGDLVDYQGHGAQDYKEYNPDGFIFPGGHPDGVANEEYFGVVDADRKPKKVFDELKVFYGTLNEKAAELAKPKIM